MKFTFFIVLSILAFGCNTSSERSTNQDAFVDVQQFFQSEITLLTKNQTGLYKRTRMDSTSNSDTLNKPEWSKELFAFLDIKIKPAVWKTDFVRVETHDDPNETASVYETTNPNQKIQSFKIKLNPDSSINRFSAQIIDKGKISTSTTGISYTQNVGYSVHVNRSTKIMGTESYQIVGQFIHPKTQNN